MHPALCVVLWARQYKTKCRVCTQQTLVARAKSMGMGFGGATTEARYACGKQFVGGPWCILRMDEWMLFMIFQGFCTWTMPHAPCELRISRTARNMICGVWRDDPLYEALEIYAGSHTIIATIITCLQGAGRQAPRHSSHPTMFPRATFIDWAWVNVLSLHPLMHLQVCARLLIHVATSAQTCMRIRLPCQTSSCMPSWLLSSSDEGCASLD